MSSHVLNILFVTDLVFSSRVWWGHFCAENAKAKCWSRRSFTIFILCFDKKLENSKLCSLLAAFFRSVRSYVQTIARGLRPALRGL
jgi:hypothetical protein